MRTDLLVSPERAAQLRADSRAWPSLDLSPRQLCDLELLLNGAFAPLPGFMTRDDYESVTQRARLSDDTIWPTPITLDLAPSTQHQFRTGDRVALRDHEGLMVAALDVADVWAGPDARRYLGGRLEGVRLPVHHDFTHLRKTPAQVQEEFAGAGWSKIAALQTDSPAPVAEIPPALAAAGEQHAGLFVHLIAGTGSPDDLTHYGRVRAYDETLRQYGSAAMLAILPMWLDGRDRLMTLRAIVAKNFGCTHLLVSGDIPSEARKHSWEIGIDLVAMAGAAATEIPRAAAAAERTRRGFTVFFTGLSGSGKSTIANALLVKLLEAGDRTVSLLDGDVVRKHLSSELGFSKEHRDLNVRRIAYVASEITKHGGIAICAPIAPYDGVRQQVRRMIEAHGRFVLVYVSTPLAVCEERDHKGLYAKARAGLLPQFTGISDPYEPPRDADISIDTERLSADAASTRILEYLRREGYLPR